MFADVPVSAVFARETSAGLFVETAGMLLSSSSLYYVKNIFFKDRKKKEKKKSVR